MFLLGNWKNFEDLEECLSLPEIKIILETHGTEKRRDQVFYAAMQGIDLEEQAYKARYKQVQERAKAKLEEESSEDLASKSLFELGMFVETDEEGIV